MREPIYIGSYQTRLTMLRCPACNGPADGATSVSKSGGPKKPQAGDLTMCVYCGVLMFYEDSLASPCPLRLRIATKAEIAAFRLQSPDLSSVLDRASEWFVKGKPQ